MDVTTITIPKEEAIEKLQEYRNIAVSKRRDEDADFRRMFRAASKGYPLIDVSRAFQSTGLNEKGQPKLAMARADWEICWWHRWDRRFSNSRRYYKANSFRVPEIAWDWNRAVQNGDLSVPVPFVPPAIRPEGDMNKFWILFEVQNWTEYPADPFLLQRVSGWLYAVIGEWELTELERSLLSGRT